MKSVVEVAASNASSPKGVVADLVEAFASHDASVVLFFVSSERDLAALAPQMSAAFPDAIVAGCTTCGEVGPAGCTTGAVSALALSEPVRASASLVENLAEFRFHDGEKVVAHLAEGLGRTPAQLPQRAHAYSLVTLSDGLSGAEEILVASLATYAPKLPLVGGSAADDFNFSRTYVSLGDQVTSSGAVVLMLEPCVPFVPFYLHHYEALPAKHVVTRAEPARRKIQRMDGRNAVDVLAEIMGCDADELRANPTPILAASQVVFGFRVGGDTHLRSVMSVQDNALLMGGAVEEGALLYEMKAGDLIDETARGIERARERLGSATGGLLFNCGGRIWEATNSERTTELAAAMSAIPTAGFTTYGEQFGALTVNHTLTGLLFGSDE